MTPGTGPVSLCLSECDHLSELCSLYAIGRIRSRLPGPIAGLSNVPTAVVQDGLRSVVPSSCRQVVQVGDDGLAGEVLYALV
jgi:hypothetical protein